MRPEVLGLGKLFEKVRDAVVVAESETKRIILWNPAAERMFGNSASEAMELRVKELVGKLLVAQAEERRRVAYKVHDGLTQTIVATHQRLQNFADEYPPNSEESREELGRALKLAQRTVIEARHVIEGRGPQALDDFGLAVAVRQKRENLKCEGWQISYEEGLEKERLPSEVETVLYRVAQEALANARKHAGAVRVRVSLKCSAPGRVRLEVVDEGSRFDPSASSQNMAAGPGEKGGPLEHAEADSPSWGVLEVKSTPGVGISVIVEVFIPLPSEEPGEYA